MAASKSKNTGRSGKGTKNTRNAKKPTAMEQEVGKFQTEIIIFVILAACVILMASNFGDGPDGIFISNRVLFRSGFYSDQQDESSGI